MERNQNEAILTRNQVLVLSFCSFSLPFSKEQRAGKPNSSVEVLVFAIVIACIKNACE